MPPLACDGATILYITVMATVLDAGFLLLPKLHG